MARPTKYRKEICQSMYDFFNCEHTKERETTYTDKKGNTYTRTIEVANPLPTFEKFAVSTGVCRDTLDQWRRDYKEFSDTYSICKDLQKDMLNDLAMRGFYNPTYTIFVAQNITDMKNRQIVDTSEGYSLFEKATEEKAKSYANKHTKRNTKRNAK